jgi:serine phosphatase RsbU (regulator of sigma subunit)
MHQTALAMMDTSEVLRRVFSGLEGPDLDTLCKVVVSRRVPADTIICREGKTEHEFYIINRGSVTISMQLEDGDERVLATMGAGEFFGEMALVEHKPRAATVTTNEDTELLVITQETFEQVVARNPVVALTILRQVSSSLRRADRLLIQDLQQKNEQLRHAFQELQAAQAELVEKQRMERDLEIAAEVQRSILPTHFPEVAGFSFAARARPARRVGGDFYDIRIVDGNRLGVLMADVSGKSVHAAIFMAVTRSLFLTEAQRSYSPAEVMVRVHDLLIELSGTQGMFVTAFYAVIDTENGLMRYARAGHDPPLLFRHRQVQMLPGEGRFLGMFDGFYVDEQELHLLPGDLLLLFSDGVTDAIDTASKQFGVQRLSRVFREHAASGAMAVCDAVFDDVLSFQGAASQFDDITIQVIAYEPNKIEGEG